MILFFRTQQSPNAKWKMTTFPQHHIPTWTLLYREEARLNEKKSLAFSEPSKEIQYFCSGKNSSCKLTSHWSKSAEAKIKLHIRGMESPRQYLDRAHLRLLKWSPKSWTITHWRHRTWMTSWRKDSRACQLAFILGDEYVGDFSSTFETISILCYTT